MFNFKNKTSVFIFLSFLFVSNIIVWSVVFEISEPKLLEVNFFDVGQGDSIFIETPDGYQILIDGGPSSRVLEKLGKEMPFWDRSIDLIISSHPDPDHLLGLIDVLKRYKVGLIGTNGTKSSRPEFLEFENQLIKNKVRQILLKKGAENLYRQRYLF